MSLSLLFDLVLNIKAAYYLSTRLFTFRLSRKVSRAIIPTDLLVCYRRGFSKPSPLTLKEKKNMHDSANLGSPMPSADMSALDLHVYRMC